MSNERKSLSKRFFGALKEMALAHERRRCYRHGMAEAAVIIDEYRKSPHKFINGVTLRAALNRRKDRLFENEHGLNDNGFRLSTRAGFESQCDKERDAIRRIMDRNT